MRWRDISHIKPSEAWCNKVANAEKEIKAGTKTPSEFSKLWTELKGDFAKLSNNKCWYCESKQERTDNAIDHFRPKSVYPWYALSHKNFRLACSYCNSPHKNVDAGITQGKSDLFPLFSDSPIAADESEIENEFPKLLDPCNPSDPELLDFLSDGRCCPKFPNNPSLAERASESIRIYYLDHIALVEARRMLAIDIERWIRTASRSYERWKASGANDDKADLDSAITDIKKAIDDRAEYSVFARRIVWNYRDKPIFKEYLMNV